MLLTRFSKRSSERASLIGKRGSASGFHNTEAGG
jgi:hypothetical protein